MKILITTGIYPPKTSGPAQYAYNMQAEWSKMGHKVTVRTYGLENSLPTGIRHIYYFFKILPSVVVSDVIFALDTFSVGFPSVLAAKIFGKKIILRTGGDFLWEGYVERTGDLVLLRDFYKTRKEKFSLKEKIIFSITRWTLNSVNFLVFSTEWQRQIFIEPYALDKGKTSIVENHYEKNEIFVGGVENMPQNRDFVAGTRPLKWKNISFLKEVFNDPNISSLGATLDTGQAVHAEFMKKMHDAYAVILVSLGDISPHMILDAISLDKPFIVTKENGLMNRIEDVAIVVDPKNKEDIREKVLWLLNPDNYNAQVEKIKNFSFVRTWEDIAKEYITLFKK